MSPTTIELQKSNSTGPRTEEGKQRSALNAMRHGLTARTVVMPYEDMNAYKSFCEELMADLVPETAVERQYAQTFCDTQWRLNRIRSIEDSMFALGHFEAAGNIDVDHPQVHAALTAAKVFREDSKSFVNLSLYEQRLQRQLEKSLKQLQALQSERRAQQKAERARELENRNALKMKAQSAAQAGTQFVFSTAGGQSESAPPATPPSAEHAPNDASDEANSYGAPVKIAA